MERRWTIAFLPWCNCPTLTVSTQPLPTQASPPPPPLPRLLLPRAARCRSRSAPYSPSHKKMLVSLAPNPSSSALSFVLPLSRILLLRLLESKSARLGQLVTPRFLALIWSCDRACFLPVARDRIKFFEVAIDLCGICVFVRV